MHKDITVRLYYPHSGKWVLGYKILVEHKKMGITIDPHDIMEFRQRFRWEEDNLWYASWRTIKMPNIRARLKEIPRNDKKFYSQNHYQ